MTERSQVCLFCGGNASEPDHLSRCDGRQGGAEEREEPTIPFVRARVSDPETSHAAAARLNEQPHKLTRSIRAVVRLLETHGPLTDFEIRDLWSEVWPGPFSYTLPCKARRWAEEDHLVRWTGRRAKNPTSGYTVRVWELGPVALADLEPA